MNVNDLQLSALTHAAQSDSLTGITAFSLHSLANESYFDEVSPQKASEALNAIASMAQLSQLRICYAGSLHADLSVLSACRQLKALDIGAPKQNPLQLTSLTYLCLRQSRSPVDLASNMPMAKLRELHLDHTSGEIQVKILTGVHRLCMLPIVPGFLCSMQSATCVSQRAREAILNHECAAPNCT